MNDDKLAADRLAKWNRVVSVASALGSGNPVPLALYEKELRQKHGSEVAARARKEIVALASRNGGIEGLADAGKNRGSYKRGSR